MFVCYLSMFYSYVVSFVLSFYMSRLNFLFLFVLLSSFLFLRFPHLYGILGFFEVVFFLIFPLFLSLFFSRLFFFKDFSASFVPEGSPQIMAFFVSFAELVSYFIRPFVLMLRPYLNLSLGCLVSHYLWFSFYLDSSGFYFFFGLFLFFYELFVTAVHWYIVSQILFVSEDH